MKFFTPGVISRNSLKQLRETHARYKTYLQQLGERLPLSLRSLDNLADLENGLLTKVIYDPSKRTLKLVFRSGNLIVGYFNLHLRYREVEIDPVYLATLNRIERSTIAQWNHECEFWVQELDIDKDGKFIHRILFVDHGDNRNTPKEMFPWVMFRCSELTWRKEPTKTRRLPSITRRSNTQQ